MIRHEQHPACPRCLHAIPSDANPGEYPGARSRTDNDTEVCSRCGSEEAMEQYFQGRLTPQQEWPLARVGPNYGNSLFPMAGRLE